MAGESPDKSEQRKSSGEAARQQDPRFAVFRESAAVRETGTREEATTAGEAERGGAGTERKDVGQGAKGSPPAPEVAGDRATAVFSVRGSRTVPGARSPQTSP